MAKSARKRKPTRRSRSAGASSSSRADAQPSTQTTQTTQTTRSSGSSRALRAVSSATPLGTTSRRGSVRISDFGAQAPLGTGEEVLEVAVQHLDETYVFGARAPLGNPDWTGPWDCAEFASWCLFQATRIVFGARPRNDPMLADPFTGFWAADAEASERDIGGVIVSVEQAARIAGAFVLRKPSTTRRVGHIVISDGAGGTVEAMSTRQGVRRASLSNRSWSYGILVPRVRYLMNELEVAVAPAHNVLRITTPLTSGGLVEAVQKALVARGFSPGRIDGIYGGQTAYAVAEFQAAEGLVVDGEVGDETRTALGLEGAV